VRVHAFSQQFCLFLFFLCQEFSQLGASFVNFGTTYANETRRWEIVKEEVRHHRWMTPSNEVRKLKVDTNLKTTQELLQTCSFLLLLHKNSFSNESAQEMDLRRRNLHKDLGDSVKQKHWWWVTYARIGRSYTLCSFWQSFRHRKWLPCAITRID
jgi:hypothetical protein